MPTTCPLCDAPTSRKTVRHHTKIGDGRTTDETITALVCPEGHYVLSEEQQTIALLRAARCALHDSKDVSAATFRAARKALGLTQAEVAELLGTTAETLSRYENGHLEVPRTVQLATAELAGAIERAGGDTEAAWPKGRPSRSIRVA